MKSAKMLAIPRLRSGWRRLRLSSTLRLRPEGSSAECPCRAILVLVVLALGLMVWPGQEASAGTLAAWGWNYYGQCDMPAGDDFAAVAGGYQHSLALKTDGSLAAWGYSSDGQCNVPAGNDFAATAAGYGHSLALKSDGSLAAWGRNNEGQCDVPAGNDFVAIAAGWRHNLALKSDGSLAAWGHNGFGQCDVPAGNDFAAIAADCWYSLALKSDGSVVGWGRDDYGQVGDIPAGNDFAAIAAGKSHGLALKLDGSLAAWGWNIGGQCDVPAGADFFAVAGGGGHSLALKLDGSLAAWGENGYGQCDVPAGNEFVAVAAGGLHSLAILAAPKVTAFTYQGHLTDSNDVADGLYDFQFELYDNPGSFAAQQGSTIDIKDLDVIEGQFTVELNFGSEVFNGDARWLETAVRPGNSNDPNAFVTLSPRQELTPTPYAIYAKAAETAGYAETAGSIPGAIIGTANYIAKFTGPNTLGDSVIYEEAGNVGIGKTKPQEKLDVDGPINTDSVYKIGGHTVLSTLATDTMTIVGIGAGANNTTGNSNTFLGAYAGRLNTEGNANTFLGYRAGLYTTRGRENTFSGHYAGYSNTEGRMNTFSGDNAGYSNTEGYMNTFLGKSAGYSNQTGSGNVFIGYQAGYNETGTYKLYIANSAADPPLIYGDFGTGRVGIGTTIPKAGLHLKGAGYPSSFMYLQSDAKEDAGIRLYEGDTVKWLIFNSSSDGGLRICNSAYSTSTVLFAEQSSGNVGIGTTSPTEELDVAGDITAYRYYDRNNTDYYMDPSNTGISATFAGRVGIGTLTPTEKLTVRGGNILIESFDGTDILELGKGLDYAEGFDVSESAKIDAGSVLIIDAENPGKLALSTKAYDSKVAGIVAGAKGQGSGVRLGAGEFDHDVALAGRVYCNVDATEAAVQPGDLLTTSATPGYAMKSTDYARAQGAILGKAMESLEKGQKGQILVLVTLQ